MHEHILHKESNIHESKKEKTNTKLIKKEEKISYRPVKGNSDSRNKKKE